MSTNRYALVIAGGTGSRLWPMSRKELPKQFQYLLGSETPFQHMVRLTTQVIPLEKVFVMAVPQFRDIILKQLPALPPENILFEPAQRDTGPAVTLGMLQIQQKDDKAHVAMLWADHLVLDEAVFVKVLEAGFAASEAKPEYLVSVGSKPTKADPSLGYIHMGDEAGTYAGIGLHQVKEFVEKPDQATAEKYFRSWDYLWNVGYNFMSVAEFSNQLGEVQPELVTTLSALAATHDQAGIAKLYEQLPKLSIDYLLVQKLHHILVIPADMGWSDIGTWTSLYRMMVTKSGGHMVTQGEVHSIKTENSLVFAKDRPITLVGVKDLIVVDTGDTVLVMHHDAPAADLKSLVQDTLTVTNPELL